VATMHEEAPLECVFLLRSHPHLPKYVDDTTESEIIPKGAVSNIQESVDHTNNWSTFNNLHLNLDKCKELQISFSKQSSH
jgi:hypothetical protein